jgi:type IV secretory pathway VirB3-like protein
MNRTEQNRTEQNSKVSKEEKKQKKQQDKELFQKHKAAFQDEMNERSAVFARNLLLFFGPVSLLLIILVDLNVPFFIPHFNLLIFARIGLPVILLFLFILTRFHALQKYRLFLGTASLAFLVYYITYMAAAMGNDVKVASLVMACILIVYSFSNANTLKTTLFVSLLFPLHIVLNILFKNDIKAIEYQHVIVNGPIYMLVGIILHSVVYRLKKQDFINRQIVNEQNQQMTKDLKIGQSVQESLMGSLPQKLGKNISLFLERHPFSEVSGDFYDLVKISDRQYYLFMGDVSVSGAG